MRRFLLLLAGLALVGSPTVQAQDISLDKLLNLTSLPVDLKPAQNPPAVLRDWVFQPATPQASQEALTWAWWASEGGPTPESTPPAQLSLRPNQQQLDVVLYLHRFAVYTRLRRELDRQHLTAVPVTCLGPGCSGLRYVSGTHTIAFYEGKPGDYAYMVVIQPKPLGTSAKPVPTPASSVAKRP
jgi:hypothetical protein